MQQLEHEFMKRWSPLLVLMIGSLALARGQPVPLFENFGVITGAPEIDALAFANYGTFSVGTFLPFDFQNTVNFTNTGTMSGSPGFQFDTAFSNHKRQMAGSLFNRTGATITALDFPLVVSTVNGQPFQTQLIFPSYLLISATNVESARAMRLPLVRREAGQRRQLLPGVGATRPSPGRNLCHLVPREGADRAGSPLPRDRLPAWRCFRCR